MNKWVKKKETEGEGTKKISKQERAIQRKEKELCKYTNTDKEKERKMESDE